MANENQANPQTMLVECAECDKPAIAEPRGHFICMEPLEGGPPQRWTLLTCDKMHAILVSQLDWGDEDQYEWDDPVREFPAHDRPLSAEIPLQLRQVHYEARACLRAKAYTAAAAMSGRTLEGACALHGVKGRTLQESLARMKEKELIDGRLWDWAQTLRTVRNAAAHFSDDSISKQDAEDAIAFSEALLDYLYVLNARFAALKVRRAKPAADGDDSKELTD